MTQYASFGVSSKCIHNLNPLYCCNYRNINNNNKNVTKHGICFLQNLIFNHNTLLNTIYLHCNMSIPYFSFQLLDSYELNNLHHNQNNVAKASISLKLQSLNDMCLMKVDVKALIE